MAVGSYRTGTFAPELRQYCGRKTDEDDQIGHPVGGDDIQKLSIDSLGSHVGKWLGSRQLFASILECTLNAQYGVLGETAYSIALKARSTLRSSSIALAVLTPPYSDLL